MAGTFRDDLDPAVWSLVHELRISALFPLLFWLARRVPATLLLGTLALQPLVAPFAFDAGTGAPCAAWATCRPFWGEGVGGSLLVTLYFVPHFVLGCLAALHRDRLTAQLGRLPWAATLVLLALALGLMTLPVRWTDLASGAGSVLLVLLVVARPWLGGTLRTPPLLALGRVSYSLYLIHIPVFLIATYALPDAPPGLLLALLPVFALLAAFGFHRAVEEPARRWGRTLAYGSSALSRDSAKARA
jgi:peptidoglycan/LPS O-acetylase OafA/YrhL